MRDLQSRFELAVEDVRSLKRRNAELEDQLAALKVARGELKPLSQGQDWESVKQRMLAELEPDANLNEEQKQERSSIENTIRITDQIVADKDREIAELQQLLANQSESLGSLAVGAAAVAEVFDQDEAIRQERERLQEAQDEWRQKLRQAEVDISLERLRVWPGNASSWKNGCACSKRKNRSTPQARTMPVQRGASPHAADGLNAWV